MDDPMSLPPPVPPKDTPDRPSRPSAMDTDRATPASGSKRKRDGHDELDSNLRNSHLEAPGSEAHTPKRSRAGLQPSDNDASDDTTPVQPRNVRRKKGVNNLSNLNLRHAAERQARQQAESQPVLRESKFQEGSLTDKPSGRPPTAFTRYIRTDTGNVHLVDDLMEDYHNGMTSPHRSVEIDTGREQAQTAQPTSAISSQAPSAEENNGFFFRFGRSLAASFHPVRMWKQVFEETHEELRQKNLAEIRRKQALKEEAERRYAQMKASGQFEPRVLSRASLADSNITLRDSGVIFASGTPSTENKRATSHGSGLANLASESETPDVASSATKTFRSRLSFKRPSLQNLRFDLKRAKSDYTLAAAANAQRDSSSSVSPVKSGFGGSTLQKSHSKIDMRKQYKLSKRVSNLESKLQLARKELDDALIEASPMPKLGNKYELFTPYSTVKRPTFIPGKLESLPSERFLDPSLYNFETDETNPVMDDRDEATDVEAGSAEPLQHLMDASEPEGPDEDTIRVARVRPYPPRASSLFNLDNKNIEGPDEDMIRVTRAGPYPPRASSLFNLDNKNIEDAHEEFVADPTKPVKEDSEEDNMDVDSPSAKANGSRSDPKKAASYASLHAKLKALDANVKMASKRPTQRKKRKSSEDMKDYRPGANDDDDEDDEDAKWERLGPRNKRRKSSGAPKKKAASKPNTTSDEPAANNTHNEVENGDADTIEPTRSNDDTTAEHNARENLDSPHAILAPVAEEDGEETGSVKEDPVKKPIDSPQQDAKQRLTTRAAEAAREYRSRSPPAREEATLFKQTDVNAEQAAFLTKPGGAKSTKSSHGCSRKDMTKANESFEWPDDVF